MRTRHHGAVMRWPVLIYGVLAYLLGIRSLVYFVFFVSDVPFVKTVDDGSTGAWTQALIVDLALLVLFALPHSLMPRKAFQRLFAEGFPEAIQRSTYVLVSALSLSLLMWQWRPIRGVVWEIDSELAAAVLIALGIAGWVLAAVAYYSIGHLQLLGLRQAYSYFRRDPLQPQDLVTSGIYRYLRDPMYVGFVIGMWSTPRMTAGHLLLSVGMTLYTLIGWRYERRDLAARFGDRYQRYLKSGH